MNRISNRSTQAAVARNVRLRRVEQRLASLDAALYTIGVALWQTDAQLNLIDCMGIAVAEGYTGRPIGEFYRDVCALPPEETEPVRAHQDALEGESVTLHWTHRSDQYLLMVEPRRGPSGSIIGTVGMSVRLGSQK